MHPLRDNVVSCIVEHWRNASPENLAKAVEYYVAAYDRFASEGLADPRFEAELCLGSPTKYAQRMAEVTLADTFWRNGFELSSSPKGPDLKVTKDGKSAWVELATPEPRGLEPYLASTHSGDAVSVPHEARTLRWTAAVRAKALMLMGDPGKRKGYLEDGIVSPNDPYVIAVNAQLLDGYHWDINGISQRPYPVEVMFALGPQGWKVGGSPDELQKPTFLHRPEVESNNGQPVASNLFLGPSFAPVSAVLGIDLHNAPVWDLAVPSAVAYDPYAKNPIPARWLPAQEHWMADIAESGLEYRLRDVTTRELNE